MFQNSKRLLHTSRVCLARKQAPKKKAKFVPRDKTSKSTAEVPLRITPPITPTVKNFEVSDDHPLWQFFHEQSYLRQFDELDKNSRSWTIPELRRKNFNDLHSLWYTCLKERNILAREQHLLNVDSERAAQPYGDLAEKVRETMWRIRHVLSERHHAHERSQELLPEQKEQILNEFKENFLTATKDEEVELQQTLSRLQYAIFGISEIIADNIVDKHFVEGLKFIANLKLERYAKDHPDFQELTPITDAGEAFVLFHSEPTTKSITESIESVKNLRSNNIRVDKLYEIESVTEFVNKLVDESQ
ncbi:hypothetical protein BN7_5960 [Wickerhamomyces ciferrii]|uniref:Large ribosomal subunit protein uL29m n=1 Tax=Wickerhamomyces ciferrii (strain ATCC 14091 / BCRC 22168 / CBS 111 / JCM 3599 / NBRC 0793 / NRRL Y-1031 F-60-10) TaxID=1206466 RepID=K0KWJ1_WICCF|nr:uncharacterized protein BN7_5960 [Wickerhamomyces ciferrii]CCH46367.1 hypothetical protein BN7_5960 [Wickerhamomyces ciferrii]